jgi:hypothetical protein
MLAELYDAAWGVSSFFGAFFRAHGYFSFGIGFRSIAAVWLIACTWLASLRAARFLLPQGPLVLRWSGMFCCGMWLATVGFHALRGLHAFALGWALLASTGLLAATHFVRRDRWPLVVCLWREAHDVGAVARLVRRSPYFPFWVIFAAGGALLGLRSLIIPPLGWDTMTYHGPRAAQWVQSGKFTFDAGVGSYDFYRHFFAGAEVLMAWAMLPFHSDLFANLASFVQWIGLGLSAWALARAMGLREPFASTSASVLMFTPVLQLEVGSGYVELALNAALLNGIAVALVCLRRPRPGALVLCALALGLAAGIKLPGAPPAAVVAGVLAIRFLATRTLSHRTKLASAAISIAVALLPAAPWLGRAYRDTGYPLSPLPAQLFGMTLGVASPMMRWYAHRPQLTPYAWDAEKGSLLSIFTPLSRLGETPSSWALVPLLLLPVGLVAFARRRPIAALALTTAALMPVLAHYSEGMIPVRLLRAQSSARFLLPTFALIVPLSLTWCRAWRPLAVAYRWVLLGYSLAQLVLCMRRGWGDWEHRELAIVALALALFVGSVRRLARTRPFRAFGLAIVLCMWFCSGLQLRRDETLGLALQKSYALVNFPRFWVEGVALVDEPEHPRTIAITGGPDRSSDKWFHYFYLGRRFQNRMRYVIPTRDGGVAHFGKGGDLDARADRDSWLGRLDESGATEVLTFPPRSLEQRWMEEEVPDRFEKLAGKDDWGLFRYRR